VEQKQKKQELDLSLGDISCTNNEKRYKSDPVLCKIPADSDRLPSRIQSLKTSLAAFLILSPLLFGLTFDNKIISTKGLGKDVLHRWLTLGGSLTTSNTTVSVRAIKKFASLENAKTPSRYFLQSPEGFAVSFLAPLQKVDDTSIKNITGFSMVKKINPAQSWASVN